MLPLLEHGECYRRERKSVSRTECESSIDCPFVLFSGVGFLLSFGYLSYIVNSAFVVSVVVSAILLFVSFLVDVS